MDLVAMVGVLESVGSARIRIPFIHLVVDVVEFRAAAIATYGFIRCTYIQVTSYLEFPVSRRRRQQAIKQKR